MSTPNPAIVPEHIALDHPHGLSLRRSRVSDAEAIVLSVTESRDHLVPWMPWASSADSFDVTFQRSRLADREVDWDQGVEYNYVLVGNDPQRILGSCGIMTRRGPRTLEIGYWTHVDFGGRGYARSLAKALTQVAERAPGVAQIYVCCDAANVRSAAIPRALGYRLEAIIDREPTAPGESGREMIWVKPGMG